MYIAGAAAAQCVFCGMSYGPSRETRFIQSGTRWHVRQAQIADSWVENRSANWIIKLSELSRAITPSTSPIREDQPDRRRPPVSAEHVASTVPGKHS
jgi:hypothetical protein